MALARRHAELELLPTGLQQHEADAVGTVTATVTAVRSKLCAVLALQCRT